MDYIYEIYAKFLNLYYNPALRDQKNFEYRQSFSSRLYYWLLDINDCDVISYTIHEFSNKI